MQTGVGTYRRSRSAWISKSTLNWTQFTSLELLSVRVTSFPLFSTSLPPVLKSSSPGTQEAQTTTVTRGTACIPSKLASSSWDAKLTTQLHNLRTTKQVSTELLSLQWEGATSFPPSSVFAWQEHHCSSSGWCVQRYETSVNLRLSSSVCTKC